MNLTPPVPAETVATRREHLNNVAPDATGRSWVRLPIAGCGASGARSMGSSISIRSPRCWRRCWLGGCVSSDQVPERGRDDPAAGFAGAATGGLHQRLPVGMASGRCRGVHRASAVDEPEAADRDVDRPRVWRRRWRCSWSSLPTVVAGGLQKCLDRFGQVPQQVFHEDNRVAHVVEYEGRPGRRPSPMTRSRPCLTLSTAGSRRPGTGAARVRSPRCARALLKTVYAFGLRRNETRMLDLADLRRNLLKMSQAGSTAGCSSASARRPTGARPGAGPC